MGNVAVLGACVRLLLPDGLGFLEQAIAARMGAAAAERTSSLPGRATRGARDSDTHAAIPGSSSRSMRLLMQASARPPPFAVSTIDSLRNHTGSWSIERPVLTDACTVCALCALFCPEGAIARNDGSMAIDYLYCKGCGICEVVCPVRNAIAMEEVPA